MSNEDWFLGIGAGTHGCHRFDVIQRAVPQRLSDTEENQQ